MARDDANKVRRIKPHWLELLEGPYPKVEPERVDPKEIPGYEPPEE
jgi:hypothetical protein